MWFLFSEDEPVDQSFPRPIRTRAREYGADRMHNGNVPGPSTPRSLATPGLSPTPALDVAGKGLLPISL